MYTADLYSVITKDKNLYGTKQICIPTPRYIIFYNGIEEHEDKTVLSLSDAFSVKEEAHSLELTAVMLNINAGHNKHLMDSCKTLKDYSQYVAKVREHAETLNLEDAVELAITECICNDILADFLRRHRAEAKSMSIYEYDEEKHMRQVKEEGRQEGIIEGRQEGIIEGRSEERLELVRKKLMKGKPLAVIADELEENVEVIQFLIDEIRKNN